MRTLRTFCHPEGYTYTVDEADFLAISEFSVYDRWDDDFEIIDDVINFIHEDYVEFDSECRVEHWAAYNTHPCIFGLESLRTLDIWRGEITTITCLISKMQNLKKLKLGEYVLLSTLPDTVGDLCRLEFLDLCRSGIECLPSSIGRLQNLERLSLSSTTNLSELPEEIGDLSNLKKLWLRGSSIRTLPSTIGNLTNLQVLSLQNCTNIKSLPASFGRLSSLMYLSLKGTKIRSTISTKFSLELAKQHPVLEDIDSMGYSLDTKIDCALASNRARNRLNDFLTDGDSVLWPRLLRYAPRTFVTLRDFRFEFYTKARYPKAQAIFLLLNDELGRESFVKHLVHRYHHTYATTTDPPTVRLGVKRRNSKISKPRLGVKRRNSKISKLR